MCCRRRRSAKPVDDDAERLARLPAAIAARAAWVVAATVRNEETMFSSVTSAADQFADDAAAREDQDAVADAGKLQRIRELTMQAMPPSPPLPRIAR